MFYAYADASVKENHTVLAFFVIFEDGSKIYRRIIVKESDNNAAEAMAISELLAFLKKYRFAKGLLLVDCKVVKRQLRNKYGYIYKYISKNTYQLIKKLNIRIRIVPRKMNMAHKICYRDMFIQSQSVSKIDRFEGKQLPDFILELYAFSDFKMLFHFPNIYFHEAQVLVNDKIMQSKLIEKIGNSKIYVYENLKIKVDNGRIVKISNVM